LPFVRILRMRHAEVFLVFASLMATVANSKAMKLIQRNTFVNVQPYLSSHAYSSNSHHSLLFSSPKSTSTKSSFPFSFLTPLYCTSSSEDTRALRLSPRSPPWWPSPTYGEGSLSWSSILPSDSISLLCLAARDLRHLRIKKKTV